MLLQEERIPEESPEHLKERRAVRRLAWYKGQEGNEIKRKSSRQWKKEAGASQEAKLLSSSLTAGRACMLSASLPGPD